MATIIQRPLRRSRIFTFYPVKNLPSLASLDGAFQLQNSYIFLLIRLDAIVSLPGSPPEGQNREEQGDSMKEEGKGWENKKNKINGVPRVFTCELEQSGVFIALWCELPIWSLSGWEASGAGRDGQTTAVVKRLQYGDGNALARKGMCNGSDRNIRIHDTCSVCQSSVLLLLRGVPLYVYPLLITANPLPTSFASSWDDASWIFWGFFGRRCLVQNETKNLDDPTSTKWWLDMSATSTNKYWL